jgi:hypothetical protein
VPATAPVSPAAESPSLDLLAYRQVEEAVPVTNDRTLTLTYDEDAGQVVLEGLPCGPAGEASLSPAEGIELSFDCADGRLCQVFVEAGEPGSPPAIGEPALVAIASLFGSRARAAIERAPSRDGDPVTVAAEPEIMAAASRLARLDAVRVTSPVADSPLWAVEAAQLARQAGLDARVQAEALRAVIALERADDASSAMLAAAADAIADLVQAVEPELATRLREHASAPGSAAPHHLRSPSPAMSDTEAAGAQRGGESGGLPGWLDPRLIPPGIFQHAMSPDSELTIREKEDGILVEARIVPGADRRVLARCRARLVDPAGRRVIGATPFRSLGDLRVRAEIRERMLPGSAWVEIVDDEARPVSSSKLHHIRRAMRWAETALAAGRQVSGPAEAEWVELAAHAWERCAEDWSAACDPDRAYLAAVRRAAICPGVVTPEEPSVWAKELAGRPLLVEKPFLAERTGG